MKRFLLAIVKQNKTTHNNAGIRKHCNSSNEPLYVRVVSYPIESGSKACKLVVTFDVTDKRQAELKSQKRRKQLRKIIDQSPAIICTIDQEERFAHISLIAQKLLTG